MGMWPDVYISQRITLEPEVCLINLQRVLLKHFLTDGIDHRRSHGIAVADFDRDDFGCCHWPFRGGVRVNAMDQTCPPL